MQINNVQSTNFGALKVYKSAEFKNCDKCVKEKIKTADEMLKNTKFFNVEVFSPTDVRISSPRNAYFGVFASNVFPQVAHNPEAEDLMVLGNEEYYEYGLQKYNSILIDKFFYQAWDTSLLQDINSVDKLAKIAAELDYAAVNHNN